VNRKLTNLEYDDERVKFWYFGLLFWIIYTLRYVSSDEKKVESAARKTMYDVKWQIKWCGPSFRLLSSVGM
jgi:hypothetical protein